MTANKSRYALTMHIKPCNHNTKIMLDIAHQSSGTEWTCGISA